MRGECCEISRATSTPPRPPSKPPPPARHGQECNILKFLYALVIPPLLNPLTCCNSLIASLRSIEANMRFPWFAPPPPPPPSQLIDSTFAAIAAAVVFVVLAIVMAILTTKKMKQATKRTARLAALPEHLRLGVTLPGMRKLLSQLPSDAVEQVNAGQRR